MFRRVRKVLYVLLSIGSNGGAFRALLCGGRLAAQNEPDAGRASPLVWSRTA